MKQETEQVLSNLKDVLTLAGSRLSSVVQVTAYLTDMNDYAAFNEVYVILFGMIHADVDMDVIFPLQESLVLRHQLVCVFRLPNSHSMEKWRWLALRAWPISHSQWVQELCTRTVKLLGALFMCQARSLKIFGFIFMHIVPGCA